MSAADIAKKARRASRAGAGWVIPCPVPGHGRGRGDIHPSLSIRDGQDGRLLVNCKVGCDPIEVLRYLEPFSPSSRNTPSPKSLRVTPARPSDDDAAATARALAIWRECREDPSGIELFERYLATRGVLDAARPAFGRALRFSPRCPFTPGVRVPCMVALVVDIQTNKPLGIHRTAISAEGDNLEVSGSKRMSLGPVRGGAVKLTPDEDVTLAVAIGEGIESTLGLGVELPELAATPAWCVLNKGGIKDFPILGGVEAVFIAVDNDAEGDGQRAAQACSARWTAAGREAVHIVPKEEGADLGDLARRRHG